MLAVVCVSVYSITGPAVFAVGGGGKAGLGGVGGAGYC